MSVFVEEQLDGFRVFAFGRLLVKLLSSPLSSPDIMLLSARTISNLFEALPSCIGIVSDIDGCVTSLCSKLQNIQYIDVAEQVRVETVFTSPLMPE